MSFSRVRPPDLKLSWDGTSMEISAGKIILGRDGGCDVVISSPLASFRHARIESDQAHWIVTDLGSRNGTTVDGVTIAKPTPLHDGAAIGIADTRIVVSLSHAPVGQAAPHHQPPIRRDLRLPSHGEIVLGRDPDCDLPLPNPNVSWRHAAISVDGGQITLRDLGSRNGTHLNGRVVRVAPVTIPSEITIGPFALAVGHGTVTPRAAPAVVLEVCGVRYKVEDSEPEIDLRIGAGELVAVIGESGAGKTTLLRAITADMPVLSGQLRLGGESLERRRWDIGYVPQHDIVHPSLTVEQSLWCSARLRLPPDQTEPELRARLDTIMEALAINRHAHKRNDEISGGERKRVSVATELLGDPRLLVLDEPTSGLDPLWDARMMEVLQRRATGETSVLFVTHTTKWLGACSRLLVMARGGQIVFDGPPEAAPARFDAKSHDEIYERLERAAATSRPTAAHRHTPSAPRRRNAPPTSLRTAISAGRALIVRDVRLYRADPKNAIARIVGALAVAVLLTSIFHTNVFAGSQQVTKSAQLLFAAMFVVTMFATSSAARDLVRERDVFQRERALGVSVAAYALGKLLVLGCIAVFEAELLWGATLWLAPLHAAGAAYLQVCAIVALTAVAGVAAGLALSAFARNEAQAATSLGFVFVPQLLLAGAIVSLGQMGWGRYIAWLVPIRWAYAGAGTAIGVNHRAVHDSGFTRFYDAGFFDARCATVAGILAAFVVGLTVVLIWRLSREAG